MSNTITARIDVTKIEKERLYKGEKGTYLDIVLIPTPNAKYEQTHMVVQSVSKEERDQGIKGNILGNAKEIERGHRGYNEEPPAHRRQLAGAETKDEPDWAAEQDQDDVPF
jgi:hypothetical protein